MPSQIIQFLSNKGYDHKGRMLNQIRALPDWRLEREHDVVQWMFPTDIPSKHFDGAPILTDEDIGHMKDVPLVQDHLQQSLERMIRFYEKNDYWITQKNHNFLRLTRILRCLWLAGRVHDYVCLSRVLDNIYDEYCDIIGPETFLYWKSANNKDFLINYKSVVTKSTNNEDDGPDDDDIMPDWYNYI